MRFSVTKKEGAISIFRFSINKGGKLSHFLRLLSITGGTLSPFVFCVCCQTKNKPTKKLEDIGNISSGIPSLGSLVSKYKK